MNIPAFDRLSWQNRTHFLLSLSLLGLSIIISLRAEPGFLISSFLPFALIVLSFFQVNTHSRRGVKADYPICDTMARLTFIVLALSAFLALASRLI